jgi:hypothetical protein
LFLCTLAILKHPNFKFFFFKFFSLNQVSDFTNLPFVFLVCCLVDSVWFSDYTL